MTFDPVSFKDKLSCLAARRQIILHEQPRDTDEWRVFKIRTGKKIRTICEPCEPLKKFQQELIEVLNDLPLSDVCFSRPGKSTVDNALVHVDSNLIYKTDIADFYPNISRSKVINGLVGIYEDLQILNSFNETFADLYYLITSCFYTRIEGVPTGAPTSPTLSNFSMYKADRQLQLLANRNGYNYSRYYDDLTFSKKESSEIDLYLAEEIKHILYNYGFLTKESKSKWIAPNTHEAFEVTGISIGNGKSSVPGKIKKLVRVLLDKKAAKLLSSEDDSILSGYLAYINMVDKEYRQRLDNYFQERVSLYATDKHS